MTSLAARGRSLSALLFVIAGGIGMISSTQTWLTVSRADGGADVEVPGASALPILAPLSLTALALGAAVALVGVVLRYVLAAIALAIAALLFVLTLPIVLEAPLSSVSAAMTEATGLAGDEGISALVQGIVATAWPWAALCAWIVLAAGSLLVLLTARNWRRGGRRFETTLHRTEGPVDAVESWDELSHGEDPTR